MEEPKVGGDTPNRGNAGKGRPRGSPNKSTAEVREAIAKLVSMNIEEVDEWLGMVAYGDESLGIKPDPAKAIDLLHRMAEYHIPKLARTEVVGDKDTPLELKISWQK